MTFPMLVLAGWSAAVGLFLLWQYAAGSLDTPTPPQRDPEDEA